jgi:signal transduction histidine kinase
VAASLLIEAQMDRLVGDLIDVASVEAGKLRVAPSIHSALELLTMATSVYEPLAKERRQSLSTASVRDVNILVDLPRGAQVLGNLLSNAIKFTPQAGRIHVGFETTQDEVVYFVADSGPGVSEQQAAHIFKRFVSSGPSAGLGLGLFIAARIVESHGGRIWLDRDGDAGAVFRFTLARA